MARRASTVKGVAAERYQPCLRRFWSDETGALVIFALMLVVLMLMMGGIAVDVMRYEARRTSLQNTLDRSTLAAASLTQKQDPEAVVDDYFLKAGLAQYLRSVTVTESLNSRIVSAEALADTLPLFLPMMGVTDFLAPGVSTAEQRIGDIEIILVLDVSGSMAGTKLANLKLAAVDFVNTVTEGDEEHHISIGIVPYNAQVNLGPTLRGKFNAINQHGVVGVDCLELPDSVFTQTMMPSDLQMQMMAYADVASTTWKGDGYIETTDSTNATAKYGSASCKQNPDNIVRLPSDNPAALNGFINNLDAEGNTSIVLGLKWGVALLDPDMRSTFTDLIGTGDIPATIPDRPMDYDADVMKIIVLMTDGEHVAHERIKDGYKTGPSPIFRSNGDGRYSIRHTTGRPTLAGTNEYWVPHLDADGTTTAAGWRSTPWDSGSGVTQMNWQDIWASQRFDYVAWQLYARALGGDNSSLRTSTFNAITNTITGNWKTAAEMDTRLQQACTAARDQNVIIYGIAFQATANGQTQIRNCSTDGAAGSHYFNATTLNIGSAFDAIASNISQLRLTQ
jgi:Flp pilus assembly protein TadG